MANTSAYLTVACKLPNGLQIKVGDTSFTLNGGNSSGAIAGFGFTSVPEDFFNAWLAAYRNYQPVKAGLIFAHPKTNSAKAEAKDKVAVKTGLEPIDPTKIRGIKPEKAPQFATSIVDDDIDIDPKAR